MAQRFLKKLKLDNTNVISHGKSLTGLSEFEFEVVTGNKLIVGLHISAIDPNARVSIFIKHTISGDAPMKLAKTMTANKVGDSSAIITDIHSFFKIVVNIVGGNASYFLGVSVSNDNLTHKTDPYTKKNAQLQELAARGNDLNDLNILTNDRGVAITLSDGSLIYTE